MHKVPKEYTIFNCTLIRLIKYVTPYARQDEKETLLALARLIEDLKKIEPSSVLMYVAKDIVAAKKQLYQLDFDGIFVQLDRSYDARLKSKAESKEKENANESEIWRSTIEIFICAIESACQNLQAKSCVVRTIEELITDANVFCATKK